MLILIFDAIVKVCSPYFAFGNVEIMLAVLAQVALWFYVQFLTGMWMMLSV